MPQPIIKQLPVDLTDSEHIDRAKQQGRMVREAVILKAEAKAAAAASSAHIKALEQTITDMGRVLETGIEYRPVECFERVNRFAKTVETRRKDSGEVVSTRSLTPKEEQLAFDAMVSDSELHDHLETPES